MAFVEGPASSVIMAWRTWEVWGGRKVGGKWEGLEEGEHDCITPSSSLQIPHSVFDLPGTYDLPGIILDGYPVLLTLH